jgi:hypothetical protein
MLSRNGEGKSSGCGMASVQRCSRGSYRKHAANEFYGNKAERSLPYTYRRELQTHRRGLRHLVGMALILLTHACAVVLKLWSVSYPCEPSQSVTRAVML